jgi:hypothetical protein
MVSLHLEQNASLVDFGEDVFSYQPGLKQFSLQFDLSAVSG